MANKSDTSASAKRKNVKATASAARAKTTKRLKDSRPAKHTAGFMDFIRKQGVVGLAIGLAIGAQASELVRTIVNSIITPIVDLLVGPGGLDGLTWTVNIGARSAMFDFGALINALINFVAVAVVIYFVIIGLHLDKLDKSKDA